MFDFHIWKIDFHVCKNKVCFFRSLVVILSLFSYWCSWWVKFNGNRKFLVLHIILLLLIWIFSAVTLFWIGLEGSVCCEFKYLIEKLAYSQLDWYDYWSKVSQKVALWSKLNNTLSPPRKWAGTTLCHCESGDSGCDTCIGIVTFKSVWELVGVWRVWNTSTEPQSTYL